LQTARRGCDIDYIRAQAQRGKLEGNTRARARFDKKIDESAPAQSWNFFKGAFSHAFEGLCRFEQNPNLIRGELVKPKEIFARPVC
jgi:hypothetical protein